MSQDNGSTGNSQVESGQLIPEVTHTLSSEGADASEDGTGRGTPIVAISMRGRDGGSTPELSEVPSALRASQGGGDKAYAQQGMAVRRLTPTECERLQGFPDGWTAGQSDSVRYRQLGNAVAVPVAAWLARRLGGD